MDAPAGGEIVRLTLDDDLAPEAYRLSVGAGSGIGIAGGDGAGVFYGLQSLLALVPPGDERGAVTLPEVTVQDAPRFSYRGMHLDVARNFQSAESVEKLLDLMAAYKLNRFHFHLTDDEGWRFEIASLPELTEVGARRGHTTDERDRLVPSFGSGPHPDSPPGSGFFDRETFVGLLRYARERHIEVIPELDFPSHARAAIKSMEARQARLLAEGRDPAQAAEYLLRDPEDSSEYLSVQLWRDNVVDVCQPSTYRFVRAVVAGVIELYAEAGAPLTAIHIGGDELPEGVWEGSPACQRLIASGEVAGTAELTGYFARELSEILAEHGLATAGWEEIALDKAGGEGGPVPATALLDRNLRLYVWNNVWGWGAEDVAYRLANAGFPTVLCGVTNLYLDMAYDKDPREPGYYWGGFVGTRQPFELVPLDIFKSARVDSLGRPIDPAAYADRVRLTPEGRRRVLGIQGQLWSENVKSPELMEYLAFPKLLALAERAWAAQPDWARIEDVSRRERELAAAWNRFANRLGQRELPRLDHLFGGVAYRLPPPGAVIEEGKLNANVAFPGLAVRYTTDGSEPTPTSTLYTGPVPVAAPIRLRSFDTRGRGSRESFAE